MAIKLTKNEQKVQKDLLKQYQRYLPTLQLKKQQLQQVIMTTRAPAAWRGSATCWRAGNTACSAGEM